MLALYRDAHPWSRTSRELTDLLNQRDRDFCIASLRLDAAFAVMMSAGPVVDAVAMSAAGPCWMFCQSALERFGYMTERKRGVCG